LKGKVPNSKRMKVNHQYKPTEGGEVTQKSTLGLRKERKTYELSGKADGKQSPYSSREVDWDPAVTNRTPGEQIKESSSMS